MPARPDQSCCITASTPSAPRETADCSAATDGGRTASTVYGQVWANARQRVFTAEVVAGPLAKRPYDLHHAAVSTWLNGGVEATRVAKWAGHRLAVCGSGVSAAHRVATPSGALEAVGPE
jgi:hypothetical protein